MYIFRWLSLILTGAILGFGPIFQGFVTPGLQVNEPLLISITIAQAEATVGKGMNWRVSLTPQEGQRLRSVEMRSGDQESWIWPEGVQTIQVLTNTVVLNIAAIPLVTGNLTPVIEVRYIVGNREHHQVAITANPVAVQPVEAQIEANVLATLGTVKKEGPLPVELWLHNSSPFTLTHMEAGGSGIDLVWDRSIILQDVPPGKTNIQSLMPKVTGSHPQPQLTVFYTWTDDTGTAHDQSLYITGEIVALEEGVFDKISDQSIGLLLGVAAGVLTTLLTTLAVSVYNQRRQKKSNREQVHGLLRLLIEKSEQAADNGVNIDLESIETIYKQEGLSAILKEDNLTIVTHDLWKTARCYNLGLNQPGGAQRTDELRRAAQRLRDKLAQKTT